MQLSMRFLCTKNRKIFNKNLLLQTLDNFSKSKKSTRRKRYVVYIPLLIWLIGTVGPTIFKSGGEV